MTQSPRTSFHESVHGACVLDAGLGWAVCLTASNVGLSAKARIGNRIRVVVAESGNRTDDEPLVGQLQTAAMRLAVQGYSARRSLGVLSRVLGRVRDASKPRPSLVLLDLYESGYVETSSLNAPSVIHVVSNRYPMHTEPVDMSEIHSAIVVTDDGDTLLALSHTAVCDVTPDVVNKVLANTYNFARPCSFRDDLRRYEDTRTSASHAPPMAVILRSRTKVDPSA